MSSQQKSNYTERYYDEVDSLWEELRESPFGKSIGGVPQEDTLQDVGPIGWVEVLDQTTGDPIVEINQDGMTWLHNPKHEDGGADEINVTGLSGLLADPQTPLAHAASHSENAADELLVEALGSASIDTTKFFQPDGLGGVQLGTPSTVPSAHAVSHQDAGTDEISVTGLSGLLADAQTALAHASTHEIAGGDDLEVDLLTTTEVDTSLRLAPDGAGGLVWAVGGGGITDHGALSGLGDDDHPQYATNVEFDDHSARHEDAGADEISIAGLLGEAAAAQKVKDHTHAATGTGADGGGSTLAPSVIDMPNAGTFSLGDIDISRSVANQLDLATGDSLMALDGPIYSRYPTGGGDGQSALRGGEVVVWLDKDDASPSASYGSTLIRFGDGTGYDTMLSRDAANRLMLASGDNLKFESGWANAYDPRRVPYRVHQYFRELGAFPLTTDNFMFQVESTAGSFSSFATTLAPFTTAAMNTGATSSGGARIVDIGSWGKTFIMRTGFTYIVRGMFRLASNLSDGTNRYHVWFGLSDLPMVADSSDPMVSAGHHMGFRLRDDVFGNNWNARTANGGAGTTSDTGVASAVNGEYLLEIVATTTQVDYYINGSLVVSNTTDVPTGSMAFTSGIRKAAGATNRNCTLYWVEIIAIDDEPPVASAYPGL